MVSVFQASTSYNCSFGSSSLRHLSTLLPRLTHYPTSNSTLHVFFLIASLCMFRVITTAYQYQNHIHLSTFSSTLHPPCPYLLYSMFPPFPHSFRFIPSPHSPLSALPTATSSLLYTPFTLLSLLPLPPYLHYIHPPPPLRSILSFILLTPVAVLVSC